MLELIKDFESFQIFYYWIDPDTGKQVSPKLPTLEYAREWWLSYYTDQYSGEERRSSKIDRREKSAKMKLGGTRIFFSKRKPQSCQGRRVTDVPVQVSLDLTIPKLAEIKA
ncbi:hypothetical protein [Neptuniibacter caesariensis]|uniref:Uncharacterized protein n=1 Tax=Neptuniibacter caesariensis TaxID=207954 RepID=A0A7U8C5X0_NEPCE|nr:hypothetical protein [Neptuniibacter caesariensis]EAR60456.1 hypothetical protein MED92_09006 [Oceanospirillum sp. MED92] [Neptuniibacter caesariensis]